MLIDLRKVRLNPVQWDRHARLAFTDTHWKARMCLERQITRMMRSIAWEDGMNEREKRSACVEILFKLGLMSIWREKETVTLEEKC